MSEERQAILKAAETEFADVGLIDSTLESIAARAGLEAGAVRAFFVDKPTLLKELLKEATHPLVSGVALAVEEINDSKEFVRKSLQLYDRWMLDHPGIVRIMVRCMLDGPEALAQLYQQSLLPSDFYERLEHSVNGGEFRCKNLFILSLLFDSLIMCPHMIGSTIALMNPEQSVEKTMETRFEAMIDLFENGLYAD